jgi:transcriptional regulator with XRE-family HTH domain
LGRRSGTSQAQIVRIETGKVLPTIGVLDRLSHALGVDLIVRFEPLLALHAGDAPVAQGDAAGH